jgi:hypothetical protein
MTWAEAAERDANRREQETVDRERHSREIEPQTLTFEAFEPPLRPRRTSASSTSSNDEEEEDEALIPPPSIAPAALTVSRARRKRAPIMKALEAEIVFKRGMGHSKGRGRGRGDRRVK